MEILPSEILNYISKFLTSVKDLQSMRITSKTLMHAIPLISIKIKLFKQIICNRIKNNKRKYCINSNCRIFIKSRRGEEPYYLFKRPKKAALNETFINYLNHNTDINLLISTRLKANANLEESEKINNIFVSPFEVSGCAAQIYDNMLNLNKEKEKNYELVKFTKRNIPYCFECMNLYVTY